MLFKGGSKVVQVGSKMVQKWFKVILLISSEWSMAVVVQWGREVEYTEYNAYYQWLKFSVTMFKVQFLMTKI